MSRSSRMRRPWTEPSVTFDGIDDHVTGAGLAPLPVQRPIPVWFGGQSLPPTGVADFYWGTAGSPGAAGREASMRPAGSWRRPPWRPAYRDPAGIGMEGRVTFAA